MRCGRLRRGPFLRSAAPSPTHEIVRPRSFARGGAKCPKVAQIELAGKGPVGNSRLLGTAHGIAAIDANWHCRRCQRGLKSTEVNLRALADRQDDALAVIVEEVQLASVDRNSYSLADRERRGASVLDHHGPAVYRAIHVAGPSQVDGARALPHPSFCEPRPSARQPSSVRSRCFARRSCAGRVRSSGKPWQSHARSAWNRWHVFRRSRVRRS